MRHCQIVVLLILGNLLLNVHSSYASKLDSLLAALKATSRSDTDYVTIANGAVEAYLLQNESDSAIQLATRALQAASQLHFSRGEAQSKFLLGKSFIYKSNYVAGMQWIVQARKDYQSLHDERGMAACSFQEGIVSYYTNKTYTEALKDFNESRDSYRLLGDSLMTSVSTYLIGLCYSDLGNYLKAEEELRSALASKKAIGDDHGYYECLGGLANVLLATGRYEESSKFHKECLVFFEKEENLAGVAQAHLGLGKVSMATNKDDSALNFLQKAFSEGKQSSYSPVILNSSQLLYENFEKRMDYKNALFYLKQYYAARDSEFNADNARKIAALQYDLDLTRKQSQIDRLSQQRQTDRIFQILLLAGIAVLLFFLVLWYQRYRFKLKTNQQLEKINEDLNNTMTTLKKTQSQLLLSEKLASVGQLTAGVAHEINNPINFVTGNISPLKRNFAALKNLLQKIEELKEGTDPQSKLAEIESLKKEIDFDYTMEESEKLLSGIEEGSRRTAAIVKGLRQFSRIDEDTKKLANINEGIESTLLLLQNKLKFQNIEVVPSFGDIPQIHCFPGQLNQVFMNLLTNAIDAIGSNGKIFIITALEGDRLKISVRDTGQGMPEEVKKKIFDPFFTTKEVGKGTGLGLSISYGIIEKHNGTIEVRSEPGKGTEFIILLPL
ncbi:MAG: tetratricopeptide repeat-containing sensor histidine kinase [Bacteroidetes bacterium]|nr:tetratricopeptide repeat-containing sensor histidine kinase [Bacteroidota bacterium]